MFEALQIKILILFRSYMLASPWISVAIFGTLGVVLFFMQAKGGSRSRAPGVIGFSSILLAGLHFYKSPYVVAFIDRLIDMVTAPVLGNTPVPIIEPLLNSLVGPYQSRSFPEEVFALAVFGYLASVLFHAINSYVKNGSLLDGGAASLTGLIPSIFGGTKRRPKRSLTNELGSGDFAATEQILKWTRPSGDPGDTKLAVSELRGSDGVALKAGHLVMPRESRNRHMLIIAKTGSGKTTKMIYPVIYNDCLCKNRSTIVLDSKPEMWRKFAAMTRKYNPEKEIMLFNPLDRLRSMSWNILSKIEDDTDCKLIANTLVMATDLPTSKGDSPFFRNNALALLNAVMVGLLNDPNEVLSMPRIHQLVQSGMKNLCDWLEAHPLAIRTARAFVELARSGSQNADTVMSELTMRISAWDITAIRATTFMDELNIHKLIEKPSLLIIELRESELEMLRPMANVLVIEILRYLTKAAEKFGGKLPRPVGLVIDEFASALGKLPDIHVKLNTLRSRNVSIVAAIQSISQVKANYADDADSVLSGFSTKIFMPALDFSDSEWASKETGQMTIRFQTKSTGKNAKLTEMFASMNDGSQEQVQQRAVLTPDEIGKPVDNICTFFLPNTPVFQGHMVPYYQIPEMNRRIHEFDSESKELKIRESAIEYEEAQAPASSGGSTGGSGGNAGGLPSGITDTKGWSDEKIRTKMEEVKKKLDWDNTTGSARKWWEAFENENKTRLALVLRLAEELQNRKATVTEFFLAYVYSNTDNIQANLHYLDYTRLKKEEEKKKKDGGVGTAKAA